MATIKSLARQLRKLNIDKLKRDAVRNQKHLFVEIQQQQLRQGVDSKGKMIQPTYPGFHLGSYAKFKATLSTYHAPMGVPDLYLTGSFARGIKMIIATAKYEFISTDSKYTKLTKKYGKTIWGIATFNMPRIRAACNIELRKLIDLKLK